MKKSKREKLELIDMKTLIVGIDIAKNVHWANLMDFRLINQCKPLRFENTKSGYESLVEVIEKLMVQNDFDSVLIGMEPTGHYWKALATFLTTKGIRSVLVNPHHVKKQKEAEDNTPNKNDKKDARLIGKIVRNGDFSFSPVFKGIWADLRNVHNLRMDVRQKMSAVETQIQVILDQYFPEYTKAFRHLWGKASTYLLNHRPFPKDILEVGEEVLAEELKRATSNRVGMKRAQKVRQLAEESIGLTEGLEGARLHLKMLMGQLEFYQNQLKVIESEQEKKLKQTGIAEYLLSVPGVGVTTAAGFLGEVGDLSQYTHPRQLQAMAGLNLAAQSSGQKQGRLTISKRGRSSLRSLLYQLAMVSVAKNPEIKQLYHYFLTRPEHPMKPKKALIAISVKILRVLFTLGKRKRTYDSTVILGQVRQEQINTIAA